MGENRGMDDSSHDSTPGQGMLTRRNGADRAGTLDPTSSAPGGDRGRDVTRLADARILLVQHYYDQLARADGENWAILHGGKIVVLRLVAGKIQVHFVDRDDNGMSELDQIYRESRNDDCPPHRRRVPTREDAEHRRVLARPDR